MAYGFEAYKEDGSILFETERICYGLIKSGYLDLVDRWGRHYLRSINLPPNESDSWRYQDFRDPICAITVTDAQSPIVFLSGDGTPCGDSFSGNSRTMYFHGVSPGTKAYVFDLMRDVGARDGMECYSSSGALTFTTGMPPLNIAAAIPAPALGPLYPGTTQINGPVYEGGYTEEYLRPWGGDDYYWAKGVRGVGVLSGELAAHLTFSRTGTMTQAIGSGAGLQLTCAEGVGGGNGLIRFYFMPSIATTSVVSSTNASVFFDIPRDRSPTALVIQTANYPFPFR